MRPPRGGCRGYTSVPPTNTRSVAARGCPAGLHEGHELPAWDELHDALLGAPSVLSARAGPPFRTRRATRASISKVGRPVAATMGVTRVASGRAPSSSSSVTACSSENGPLRVRHRS